MQLTINATQIWVCSAPVDFRRSIDGLSEVIISQFNRTPSDGLFIFFNRSRDKAKLLAWHTNGFVLLYKRLERGRFTVLKTGDELISLEPRQLSWLLAGLDWVSMSRWNELEYEDYN